MDSAKREMSSLEKELRLLRPFVRTQFVGTRRCYSEEEILAVEQRLDYKLPSPIRTVYSFMADLLIDSYYLRPLELLHWDNDHLGFFLSSNWDCIVGIYRNAEPNSLYFWEEDDPEDNSYAIVDEFEECEMKGDESGKQKAAQDYLKYWEAIKNNLASSHEAFNSQRFNWSLDAYALFLSLHTICECSEMLAHKANRGIDPENLELYLRSDPIKSDIASLEYLATRIQQIFVPLSEQTVLIKDETPILMAYVHPKEKMLLVFQIEDTKLTLLSPSMINPEVLKSIEKHIGLTFQKMCYPL